MEGRERKPDWSYWRRFDLSWKLGPEERAWLRGDPDVAFSRGAGFILAMLIGIGGAIMELCWTGPSGVNYLRLAVDLALVGLGVLLLRGEKYAALGLMALYPGALIIGHLTSYFRGDAYYVHHLGLWLSGGLLSVAAWIYLFTIAYRAELRWAALEEAPPPDAASPPAGD